MPRRRMQQTALAIALMRNPLVAFLARSGSHRFHDLVEEFVPDTYPSSGALDEQLRLLGRWVERETDRAGLREGSSFSLTDEARRALKPACRTRGAA